MRQEFAWFHGSPPILQRIPHVTMGWEPLGIIPTAWHSYDMWIKATQTAMKTLTRATEHPQNEWISSPTRQHCHPLINGGTHSPNSSIATHPPEISDGRHIQAIFGRFVI
jgi:hypothetical protein